MSELLRGAVMSHVTGVSHVTYHISHVTYHMSHVTCHMSHVCVTCHMSHVTPALCDDQTAVEEGLGMME